jgi:hypothetical protein
MQQHHQRAACDGDGHINQHPQPSRIIAESLDRAQAATLGQRQAWFDPPLGQLCLGDPRA